MSDAYINASKNSSLKESKKYYGNYLGIVIQNNDPDNAGKIKVWVPHISPSVYLKWDDSKEDKKFRFIGKNINSDITDIVEDLKAILPWSVCAAPLNGSSGSGRYNSYDQKATISDSNNPDDHDYSDSYVKTKYSLNEDGVGEKPARKYEVDDLKVTDAFVNSNDIPFEHGNKYGYSYTPTSYSNSAKGSFSIPNVGAHVWMFFEDGDPTSPVYFAAAYGESDWKSIYNEQDYPGSYENKTAALQGEYNHNTTTYRNKYVVNQKGGTFEIVNTDSRELLKLTHFSGSFKEFSNYVTTEFATNNDQKLVQGDQFRTVKGYDSVYVGHDSDTIITGDVYKKIGNLKYDTFKEYKQLLDSIADAKQLFDIKRANTITTEEGFFKKTSANQQRSGTFGPCPLCTDNTTIWDNKYTFSTAASQEYKNSTTSYDFSKVTSQFDSASAGRLIVGSPGDLLGSGPCPVCDGSGSSPSTFNGTWDEEDKDTLVLERLKTIREDLVLLEKQMGRGGSEIITITKNKIENVGLILNDFPSIRVDDIGKINIDEIKVFKKGVVTTFTPTPLIEYVHVDDLPGGTKVDNINNKWNVQVGAGGVSIKSLGGVDVGGTITNIAGQQTNVVAENEVNIDSKVVNIAAEILTLRNKRNKQVVVDGNLGVNNNVVIGGSVHVEGELSVQHITAPVEIQETESVEVFSKLLQGLSFSASISNHVNEKTNNGQCTITLEADSNDDKVKAYPHTHPFKNIPLKLLNDKDDVRQVGSAANTTGRSNSIPVVHEHKGESL